MSRNSLKRPVASLMKWLTRPRKPAAAAGEVGALPPPPRHKRMLSDRPGCREAFLRGANEYVAKLAPGNFDYLHLKPYDPAPGNASYYRELYQVLNILRAMDMTPGGRILEVGSGPGWVTEILAALRFCVDCVEPSEDMIRVARDRLNACRQHHRIKEPFRVTFHRQPLEDCDLPDESFDGILFHESLHHIIDEDAGLSRCFRALVPGGVVGVSGDTVWRPENYLLEEELQIEMDRFGTLENPYTPEYLEHLFRKHGFEDVARYHGVNGLFPVAEEDRRLRDVAMFPAWEYNTFTARKPGLVGFRGPTTAQAAALTAGRIEILRARVADTFQARLTVRLTNEGKTAWLHKPRTSGWVTLALRQGECGAGDFREAGPRCRLPATVLPGQVVVVEAVYQMPKDYLGKPWRLDLVNEGFYWFSDKGSQPIEVRWDAGG